MRPGGSDISEIVAQVEPRPASAGRTRIVAVDGPACSGKTTLAGDLARALSAPRWGVGVVAVLHMDDLYEGWEGLNAELELRVVAQVLAPLADGRPARWQRYDWHASAFAEWRELQPPAVLVLEGCGSGARAYERYRTLLVWVEAARDLRLRRWLDRDGADLAAHAGAWMRAEERHFAANDTQQLADLRVRTD